MPIQLSRHPRLKLGLRLPMTNPLPTSKKLDRATITAMCLGVDEAHSTQTLGVAASTPTITIFADEGEEAL